MKLRMMFLALFIFFTNGLCANVRGLVILQSRADTIFEVDTIWPEGKGEIESMVHFEEEQLLQDVGYIQQTDPIDWQGGIQNLYLVKGNWESKKGEHFYLLYEPLKDKYYFYSALGQDIHHDLPIILNNRNEIFQPEQPNSFPCNNIIDIDKLSPYVSIVFYMLAGSLLLYILLFYVIIKFMQIIKM